MSADAERRLFLIACSVAIAAGLCALSHFVAWWVGPAAFVVGLALAVAVTLEQRPPAVEPPRPEDREGLSVREIDRRSRGVGTP